MAALSCWLAASAVAASDEPLRAPFDVEAIRAAKGKPISVEACPEPVPPISDIEGVSFYSDPQGSKPDPAKLAANEAATRPLDLFLAGVVPAANRWVRGRPAQQQIAELEIERAEGREIGGVAVVVFDWDVLTHRLQPGNGAAVAGERGV